MSAASTPPVGFGGFHGSPCNAVLWGVAFGVAGLCSRMLARLHGESRSGDLQ